jgi:hypothetical protein
MASSIYDYKITAAEAGLHAISGDFITTKLNHVRLHRLIM